MCRWEKEGAVLVRCTDALAPKFTSRQRKIDLPACFSSYSILCFLLKFVFSAIKYLKKFFKPVWIHNCRSSSADVIRVFSDLNTLKFQVMARSASFLTYVVS